MIKETELKKLKTIGSGALAENRKLRRIMLGDKDYRRYFDEKFGIDILGRLRTHVKGTFSGAKLDPDYFLDKPINKETEFKVIE